MGLRPLESGIVIGFVSCMMAVACAGAKFPYHGYAYDMADHNLVGASPSDDQPDSICMPTATNKRPCMVIMTEDYYRAKADYLKTKDALDACQRGAVQ